MLTGSQPHPPLEKFRVIDVMHPGVIACPVETPLRTVARMMASYRVHAIIVIAHEGDELPSGTLWGVISDAGLIRAAESADFEEQTAASLAATPALTVATVDPLERAVQLMVEHEVSHLIVVERRSMRPIGVVSTLDIARALAGYTEPWADAHDPGRATRPLLSERKEIRE
jgi:CBS domain-containing protein